MAKMEKALPPVEGEMAPLRVPPSGGQESTRYSDTALTNLFVAHLNFAHGERQLIWQRYAALLVGNTIVFNLLLPRDNVSWWVRLLACVFGVLLCVVWFSITYAGWELMRRQLEGARRFRWEGFDNPLEVIWKFYGIQVDQKLEPKRDWIRISALAAIVLFMIAYVFAGWLIWCWH